jgi:hypothetical protein
MPMQQQHSYDRASPGFAAPSRRLPAPVPRRRRYPGKTVPEAVVACLAEARAPTPQEVEAAAGWIWSDVRGFGPWQGAAFGPHGFAHRRILALARAALGLPPAGPEQAG